MKNFRNSVLILAICFCVFVLNVVNAGILWEKELVLNANTNSSPLASCLNKDANGVIVMTAESPKGSFPISRGDSVLWEVGVSGNTTRILPKNIDGNTIQTKAKPVGPGCAIASDNFGNLLTIGILGRQKDGQKVGIISGVDKTERIMSPRNHIENHSVKKLIPLRDNTFVLVGDRNGDGLCLRIDSEGKTIQEKLFDMGHREMLTDVDRLKPDNLSLAVVGLSARISSRNPVENSAENFILIYDSNQKIVHEDYFTEGIPGLLFPKVCCLDNGNIIVLYRKESADSKTRLWARCYTQELKLLWEKEIFVADKSPFAFDIVSRGSSGFTVGIVPQIQQNNVLEFYFFNVDGTKTGYTLYEGMVGMLGFNLMYVNGRTIAVFQEYTPGNIKECTIKAKVIALD